MQPAACASKPAAGPKLAGTLHLQLPTALPAVLCALQVLRYLLRLLADLLVLELLLHCICTNALARGRLWQQLEVASGQLLGPLRTSALGFWVLVFMWLKVGGCGCLAGLACTAA